MDVFDDWLVRDAEKIRVDQVATAELIVLHSIRDSEAPTLAKCMATIAVIDGKGKEVAIDALRTASEN